MTEEEATKTIRDSFYGTEQICYGKWVSVDGLTSYQVQFKCGGVTCLSDQFPSFDEAVEHAKQKAPADCRVPAPKPSIGTLIAKSVCDIFEVKPFSTSAESPESRLAFAIDAAIKSNSGTC